MPAVSEKQREAMAIAEHEPDKLYERNKGLKKMSHEQLHDFASKKKKLAKKMSPNKQEKDYKSFKHKYHYE